MSYLVLARKYRPSSFETVSGQEHVTRTLANAIVREKVAHAYLFCGPRGVGKTSIARIFAKALNCEQGPTPEPCQQCTNCTEIAEGTSLAVREIDGASHNSVDNVRELIESFRSLPAPGSKYKIYIIDEVHMLSTSAFNALLKSLEEPPPHTVFILATTEPHKIPQTVISRCQRFDFRALSYRDIQSCLTAISEKEGLDIEDEVFRMIARLAEGSMRDAQSLLDRVQSFCDGRITAAEAGQLLGVVARNTLIRLSQMVFDRNPSEALATVGLAFSTGLDPALFLKEFAAHWRELLLAKFGGKDALDAVGIVGEGAEELLAQVANVSNQDIQDLAQMAREGADRALRSTQPKYALEALVVRLATRERVKDMGDLLARLRSLLGGGGGSGPQKRASIPGPAARPAAPQQAAPKQTVPKQNVSSAASTAEPQAAAAPAPAAEGSLSWSDFVERVAGKAPMLCEHLRRLSVKEFSPRRLEAKGPEFTVAYLLRQENNAKLREMLGACGGGGEWQTVLTTGENAGGHEPGSLRDVEAREQSERRKKQAESVKSHPAVQRVKSAFPGSTIEQIKTKK